MQDGEGWVALAEVRREGLRGSEGRVSEEKETGLPSGTWSGARC